MGPANDHVRKRVYDAALRNPVLFKGLVKPMGTMYASVYSTDLQTHSQGKDRSFEEQLEAIQQAWETFIAGDFDLLTEHVITLDSELTDNRTGDVNRSNE
jgi:hypothetical protein